MLGVWAFAMLLLSACGVTTGAAIGGGGNVPSGAATSTPTAAKSTPARASTTNGWIAKAAGCKTTVSATSVPPASVMLPTHNVSGTIAVAVGQTVGINLPAQYRWSVVLGDASHALTLNTPQGVLDRPHNTCDWRFTATHAGAVTMNVVGIFICHPNSMCPALAIDYSFNLSIHG